MSLCLVFGKALEKIVRDQIIEVVDINSVQYGSSKGRSSIKNLLFTENFIAESLNKQHPVDIILLDFSRAFDKVPHDRLLLELNRRSVTGVALQWLRSFLTDRTQIFKTTALSSSAPVPSGMIQGFVLSTTLFSVFIDPLLRRLGLFAGAYAIDPKFMANLDHVNIVIVQSEIYIVYNWSRMMDMPLSIKKSLVLHYGTNNPCYQYYCEERELPSSVTFVDLCVVRCSDATYSEQVAKVAQKDKRLAGLCSRLLSCWNQGG